MSRGTIGVRGYGLTRWSRALVDVIEGDPPDSRRVTKARRYFRDRHVHRLHIGSGRVSAAVSGSQLDPFEVTLSFRTVDTDTVATLLRSRGGLGDLLTLTRGEQPQILGELVGPTESADISSMCTCPDEAVRCIHVLAVTYEVAAEIDRTPLTLLTVMGTDLPDLLAAFDDAADDRADQPDGDDGQGATMPSVDFYGTATTLPALPSPPRMTPLVDLDATALRAALRACGIAPGDIAEAVDELGDLYDRLHTEI